MELGRNADRSRPSRDDPPTFDLTCRFDDDDHPSEVTVYPDGDDDPATTWLTIDVGHAIPLGDVR